MLMMINCVSHIIYFGYSRKGRPSIILDRFTLCAFAGHVCGWTAHESSQCVPKKKKKVEMRSFFLLVTLFISYQTNLIPDAMGDVNTTFVVEGDRALACTIRGEVTHE